MTTATDLTIRDAAPADVPALVILVESAYRGDASRAGWTTEADLLDGQRIDPEGVIDCIERPRSRVRVAESADGILACMHVEARGDAGYFGMFAVRPALQGGGVGRALLADAERTAADVWHCTHMRMCVIDVRDDL
ncbi:MAG TPA: GNAT family N-acetyltransferase, partial [Rhodanobacteraceae bacterium]|nr:GNAT family N-acetyltransferase [Rhodanobacteraceae bacterium]